MKKKGFTLIELLAVIVILAIIALIAVPIILNVIETSKKGAAVDSAYGYLDAVEKYVALHDVDSEKYPYNIKNGTYSVSEETNGIPKLNTFIDLKGDKPIKGTVTLNPKGKATSAVLGINGYRVVCDDKNCRVAGTYEPITITYDLAGGTLDRTTEDIYKGDTINLPTPIKDGYELLGWYTGENGSGEKVTNSTVFDENTTIHANWRVAPKLVSTIENAWVYGKYYKLSNGDVFMSTNTNNLFVMLGYKGTANWSSATTQAQAYNTALSSRLMTEAEASAMGTDSNRADNTRGGIFVQIECDYNGFWFLTSDADHVRYVTNYGQVGVNYLYLSYSQNATTTKLGIRPVITIPADATYISGTGTKADPYMINNY